MSVVLPFKPDREINRLFAIIVTDPANGLQGIGAASLMGIPMQAVSSSRSNVEKILEIMKQEPKINGFKLEIVEFKR